MVINVPEYGVKSQFFTVTSIDLLLVYGNKFTCTYIYRQPCL